jgi:hypothetical protein
MAVPEDNAIGDTLGGNKHWKEFIPWLGGSGSRNRIDDGRLKLGHAENTFKFSLGESMPFHHLADESFEFRSQWCCCRGCAGRTRRASSERQKSEGIE